MNGGNSHQRRSLWRTAQAVAEILSKTPLIQHSEAPKPPTLVENLIAIAENPIVLTIVGGLLLVLMVYWPIAMYLCAGVLAFGLWRAAFSSATRKWRMAWKVLSATVLLLIAFVVVNTARHLILENVVPRALISIRSIQLFDDHGIIKAHVTGEVSGSERVMPFALVRYSFKALPCGSDWNLKNQIDELPLDQHSWGSGMDNLLDPGTRLAFNVPWIANDPEEFFRVRDGQECLFLITKSMYRDRFGPRPSKYTCSFFHKSNDFVEMRCQWGNR